VAMIEPDDKVVTTSLAVKLEFSPRRVIIFREACDLNAVACDVDSEVNSPGYVTVILTAPLIAETVGSGGGGGGGGGGGETAVDETVGDSEIKHCQNSTVSTVMVSGVPSVHEVQNDEIAVPSTQLPPKFEHTSGFL